MKKSNGTPSFLLLFLLLLSGFPGGQTEDLERMYKEGKYRELLTESLKTATLPRDFSPLQQARLNFFIGLGHYHQENRDMAATYLQKVTARPPEEFQYLKKTYITLAELYKGDYFKREGYLERLVSDFPQTPQALDSARVMGEKYLSLQNHKKTINLLLKLKQNRNTEVLPPPFNLYLMVAYAGIDDYVEALEYYRRARKNAEQILLTTPLYFFTAGKVLYSTGNFSEAIRVLERFINRYPSGRYYHDAADYLSRALEKNGQVKAGVVFLINALQKPPPRRLRHALLLNLGRMLLKIPQRERLSLSPEFRNPIRLLNMVKENSGNYDQIREATILLNDQLLESEDFQKVVDNYYRFLLEKKDKVVHDLFKKNLKRYLEYLEEHREYPHLFQLWVTLKNRKSLMSGEILIQLADQLKKLRLYVNADEIYSHILGYKLYSSWWDHAAGQHARILYRLGEYDELLRFFQGRAPSVDLDKREFDYLKSMALFRSDAGKKDLLMDFLNSLDLTPGRNHHEQSLLMLKAKLLENRRQHRESLELLLQLSKNPVSDMKRAERAKLYIQLGDTCYLEGQPQKALQYYRKAEGYKFSLEWIYYRQIKCLQLLNQNPRETIKKLETAFPASPWLKKVEAP